MDAGFLAVLTATALWAVIMILVIRTEARRGDTKPK